MVERRVRIKITANSLADLVHIVMIIIALSHMTWNIIGLTRLKTVKSCFASMR